MKVIIVGAGIGGLTLGLELIRDGIDVEIYERASTLQPVGAGIMLAPNAIKVLEKLGLSQKLENIGNKVSRTAIQDSVGEPISTVDMTFGAKRETSGFSLALHRGALHRLLVEEVGPENIKLGQTYLTSEDTQDCIFALFASGETARGDFLVGCDGVNSAVRTNLFGAPKRRYSGQLCWRGVAEFPEREHRELKCYEFVERWGNGLRFGYVRISCEQVYWYATRTQESNQHVDVAMLKKELEVAFADFSYPVKSLLESTDLQQMIQHELFDVAPTRMWSKGRTCLLGDSIHPTTPNLGQGAGMAIESAAVLAHTIRKEATLEAAFHEYEVLRFPRTREVTLDSWRIGQVTNWRTGFGCGFRNWMMRMVPESLGLKRYIKFVNADLFSN
jgi:2-polyprenyl-6-methoxyphenol hydroxylase-like FAD-dependent oxidoreductase